MQTYRYANSATLFDRARKVIPNGVYGHFNPATQKPANYYPFYVESAKGSKLRDVDGNEFIDYMCAYGPMILGYGDEHVDRAYLAQLDEVNASTMSAPVMIELAEFLVSLIEPAEWALFAKNGADVTNMAVLIARAASGRRKILAIEGGYHGASPWMQAADRDGIIEDDHRHVIRVAWNDVAALERVLDEHSGDVAAFISSPYHHPAFQDNVLPEPDYWSQVTKLLKKHQILMICDDVRCGFRIDMGGSHEYFGFEPDMICYCKALANGYPIAALVGRDSIRDAAEHVFQTGSFWFSAAPMAAALACLKRLQQTSAPSAILEIGQALIDGMNDVANSHGVALKATGMPSMPYVRFVHESGIDFHRLLCAECTRRGAYFTSHHNWFLSSAHTEDDIRRTCDILDDAIGAMKSSS